MASELAAEVAKNAIVRISQTMADDAEFLAAEIEVRGLPLSGPEALRLFAAGVREATKKTADL